MMCYSGMLGFVTLCVVKYSNSEWGFGYFTLHICHWGWKRKEWSIFVHNRCQICQINLGRLAESVISCAVFQMAFSTDYVMFCCGRTLYIRHLLLRHSSVRWLIHKAVSLFEDVLQRCLVQGSSLRSLFWSPWIQCTSSYTVSSEIYLNVTAPRTPSVNLVISCVCGKTVVFFRLRSRLKGGVSLRRTIRLFQPLCKIGAEICNFNFQNSECWVWERMPVVPILQKWLTRIFRITSMATNRDNLPPKANGFCAVDPRFSFAVVRQKFALSVVTSTEDRGPSCTLGSFSRQYCRRWSWVLLVWLVLNYF